MHSVFRSNVRCAYLGAGVVTTNLAPEEVGGDEASDLLSLLSYVGVSAGVASQLRAQRLESESTERSRRPAQEEPECRA